MNNERSSQGPTPDAEAERALKQLFAHAKPRPSPPQADAEEVRRAVYAEWDAVTGRRLFLRRAGFVAAASVALAVVLWAGLAPGPGDAAVFARVERVEGLVLDADGEPLVVGAVLGAGDAVTTGTGQIALRLASGGSLRVATQSRVALTALDSAELIAGVLYFDSEGERDAADFTVATRLGSVRDVGTQFFARLDAAASQLDIGVRDGRVELTSEGRTDAAGVGERLVVGGGSGGIRRDTIATFGGDWDWVEGVAPRFDTDGRTVGDFLTWFAAQTGRTIVFGSTEAERAARERISGTIDLPLMQQLSAVLSIADLTHAIEGERVVIDTR